jgi:hypothetical protein
MSELDSSPNLVGASNLLDQPTGPIGVREGHEGVVVAAFGIGPGHLGTVLEVEGTPYYGDWLTEEVRAFGS